jgi:hypothetical protein
LECGCKGTDKNQYEQKNKRLGLLTFLGAKVRKKKMRTNLEKSTHDN